ncbi:EAL domain-containing protein [Jidongwangia harbinensis]|uniref:EAL domain-containing protein n=1 Tax=Jidongwangia harbinensis TaxID=2878561 RepID=UPI001CDA2D5A|nr:EAL domain-containing protein [Jidongwangia harbinensis]MCA2216014.1 EAL domain-containing protein [Jidongwangia harbinensis]
MVLGDQATDGAERTGGSGERRTIGYFAPNVHGYFFGSTLSGVRQAAAARNARVVALQTHDAGMLTFRDERFTAAIAWDQLDGIVVGQAGVDGAYLRDFAASGKPVVTVYETPEDFVCPTVVPDNRQAIEAAVAHFVEHGHSRIAFVGRDPANADDWLRYGAYRDALIAHGLEPWEAVLVPCLLNEFYLGAAVIESLRADGAMPTAMVACTDATAMALINALSGAGIRVPDDVAVIGFDDLTEAAVFHPPLTTVAQSFSLAGARAAGLVFDALDGATVAPGLYFTPVTLVVRQSCGCQEVADDEISVPAGTDAARARFAADLDALLPSPSGELLPARERELAAVGRQLANLFGAAVLTPGADLGATLDRSFSVLRRITSSAPNVLSAVAPVRALARDVVERLRPGDPLVAARAERAVFDLAVRLFEHHRCVSGKAVVNVEQTRHYHTISAEVVRQDLDPASLSWLADTEVRSGTLGLWRSGRQMTDDPTLRIVGSFPYQDTGAGPETDRDPSSSGAVCPLRSFPPRAFLDEVDRHRGDLTFLLPVRFNGSAWGFLALNGSFDELEEEPFERFNHWAVLLTVALDQRLALRAEHALLEEIRVSEERYAIAAEAANDGLWDWNLDAGTIYYSPRWKVLLGHTDETIGDSPSEWFGRIHPDDRAEVDRLIAAHLASRSSTMDFEYRIQAADGTYRWMVSQGRSVLDENGRVARLVGSMTDITERQRLEEQLRHDAHFDALTGLPNRSLYLERLTRAVTRAQRSAEASFAVVFLDLNDFKTINDSLGHQIGDDVLVQVAERLTRHIRAEDTVARFGGDEFVLLIEDFGEVRDLLGVVHRILAEVAEPLVLGDQTRSVSVAAGIAASDPAGETGIRSADDYLRDADTAMYQAKGLGRGAAVLFDESMHADAMARLRLESDLDRAVADHEFELFYQPILRLAGRQPVGFEALIRWRHPERGTVAPNDFLPIAETTGHTRPIGRWTIREACRQIRTWLDENADCLAFTVSVNLSNRQFWDPDLLATVRSALADYRVPASMLIIEVTELIIMDNQSAANGVMHQLGQLGVKLYLDDFGTGYSSLSALHTFPIHALKIDRSFVVGMMTDAHRRELVRMMITIGANLGIAVIAEGIETEDEAAVLSDLGCELVQGYLFARPLPAGQASLFLPIDHEVSA